MKKLALFILEQEEAKSAKEKIVKLFSGKTPPVDKDVHALSDELKIDTHKFEGMIYEMLWSYISGIGRHRNVPDSEFDKDELAKGIKVEQEHTDDKDLAKEIAKDHLKEMPDYYTKLAKMEKENGKA